MPRRAAAAAFSTQSRRTPQPDAMFRAAADQAPQVMWIVNAKGAVTYLNQFWYELVGGLPPKWYGHEWAEVVHPEDVAEMRVRWKAASASGSIFEGTRRVKSVDGIWHTLSYRATPVFDAQGLVCWVGMDSDITELVATQAALRHVNRELQAFSYTVSHDLRTPLVTIEGFAQRLARELGPSADEKARHYIERISQAAQHMGRLVEGLLALSQVERHKLQMQDVDLSAMAREILAMLQRLQPERSATITVAAGLRTRGDSRLITSLLDNLLGNAWKFSAQRPHTEISVGLAAGSPDESVFFVKDNGAGFDMAHAAKLFSAFERLHPTAEFAGMGIGLATVQRVVQRHGGRAWAESEPGKGSSFFFALPKLH